MHIIKCLINRIMITTHDMIYINTTNDTCVHRIQSTNRV